MQLNLIRVTPRATRLLCRGRPVSRSSLLRRAVEYAVTVALALLSSYWIIGGGGR